MDKQFLYRAFYPGGIFEFTDSDDTLAQKYAKKRVKGYGVNLISLYRVGERITIIDDV